MSRRLKILVVVNIAVIASTLTLALVFKQNGNNTPPSANELTESLIRKLGFLNLSDTVAYVGTEKCARCHEDVYNNYIKTGMGMSWGLANKQKSMSVFTPGDPLFDPKTGFYYQPYWDGEDMMVHEFKLEDRETVYSRRVKVDYVVGSGQHTNSHLYSVNGYLYQVPFTYYTQQELLDFPPGFEGGNNARFTRKIGFECISCHNAYPVAVEGSINKYTDIPLGINCERCHGPGELHVKAMEEGKITDTKKYTDYTIIRPSRLPRKLQLELCTRCHSQGNSVLKKNSSFFDFKPGMYVSDVLDVFREVYENDDDAFWMETHPERMKKSKCYLGSLNHPDHEMMTCLDCHFTSTMMHTSYKLTPPDSFNRKCMNCHQEKNNTACTASIGERSSQANNCYKCHMPRTGVFDIPHVAISDHYIRVTNKWKGPVVSTNDIKTGAFRGLKCMTSETPGNHIMAKAFLYHYEKFNSLPSLLDSARGYLLKINIAECYEEWVTYHYLRNEWKKVVDLSEKYPLIQSTDPYVVYQAGQAFYNLSKVESATRYFRRATELQPFNLEFRNKLGTALLASGLNSQALKEFRYMVGEDPSQAIAYNNIGYIYLVKKKFTEAERNFRLALRYEPDYLNAHLNLARAMMSSGRLPEALSYLQQLNTKFPGNEQIKSLMTLNKQYP